MTLLPRESYHKTMKKRILLVEDNDFIRKMYALKLSKAEAFKLVEATDGKVALELLSKGKFDLMLLDIMMPAVGGIEVLEELKKRSIHTPVMILSNMMSTETREIAQRFGVVDYIIKSDLTPNEVLVRVENYFQSAKQLD